MISHNFSLGHCHHCGEHQTDHEWIEDGDIGSGHKCPNGLEKALLAVKFKDHIKEVAKEERDFQRRLQRFTERNVNRGKKNQDAIKKKKKK